MSGRIQLAETNVAERPAGKVTGKNLRELVEWQGYRCALSGVDLTPDIAEADHIKPLSKGGQHIFSNVQIVHQDVNRMKGTLGQDEFIRWCKAVADAS